jgi:HK97 family phage major capsid protein
MTRNEKLLEAVQQKREEIAGKTAEILEKQAEDDRGPTEDEARTLAQFVKDMKTLDDQEGDFKEQVRVEKEILMAGRKIGAPEDRSPLAEITNIREHKSLGEMFVESEGFKSIFENGRRRSEFSTGMIDLQTKGTLLEGAGGPGSGTGGAFITTQTLPGVVDTLFQRLTVADLLGSGQTNTNTIRYPVEGTATSGAAGVAEGGAKPESTLGLSTVDEPVKKIATMLVVSDEMLEDAAQVESYINGRLQLFVKIEEERQLVLGAGTNELVGITGRTGVHVYARGTVDNYAVALFKALNGTRGSALLEPDGIIMNPADWQTVRLLTDSAGQFFGGGPFQGPYGSGSNIQASGQVTGAIDSIWNKPVVVTSAIGAGTALLGAFSTCASVFRRSGLSVEATNSHGSLFANNLVAIRAEERLALACFRPSAFTKVLF